VRLCSLGCRWLMEAIDCIGCKPWQSVFPTRAMELERYYYTYGLADYLTPMRLYDLCRADEEGNRSCRYSPAIRTIHTTKYAHPCSYVCACMYYVGYVLAVHYPPYHHILWRLAIRSLCNARAQSPNFPICHFWLSWSPLQQCEHYRATLLYVFFRDFNNYVTLLRISKNESRFK